MHGQYVDPKNLLTQKYISTLDTWSNDHKMKLNEKKTKIMLINFTKKYQFVTRIKLKNANVEQVSEAKVLGTILSDDLSWNKNCANIIRKCHSRMQLLRTVASFGTNTETLKHIYIHIIRVILEGSCQVWDGSLTIQNRKSLERVQKQCLKIISPKLKYKEALKQLNINDLQTRRTALVTRFAKLNQHDGKISHFFEQNDKIHNMKTRNARKYNVRGNTNIYLKSPILHMKRLLNSIIRN